MSGGGSSGSSTVRNELDPTIKPYVGYGLSEAQRLYRRGGPQYYPGQTYVGMSPQTQSALGQAEQRAKMMQNYINPVTGMVGQTAAGGYLGGSPFFGGAFDAATRRARGQYEDATQQLQSQASSLGRYGSPAQQMLQDAQDATFAQALTDTAGKLAYDNYAQERARQMQAQMNLANLYESGLDRRMDATNQLLQTGQIAEGYEEAKLADAINRFNYQQNRPYANLQTFLSNVYGAPRGSEQTQPIFRNRAANVLGGGLLGAQLGQSVQGISPTYGALGGALLGML
jgi:hypothetical protein